MTYIELINNFWEIHKKVHFTSNEISLYFAILNKCNELSWKNPFNHSNNYLSYESGMTEKPFRNSKNMLKKHGLIDFKNGDGRGNNTQYFIKNLENKEEKGALKGALKGSLKGSLKEVKMTDNNRLRIYNYYHNYIIEYWNKNFINLPKISNLSENRKNKINARLNDFGDEENWLNTIDEIFKKISESEFLSGNNNQGWKCNFDWVFANDKNYLKILEGNYDNKKNKQNEIRRHQDLFNSGRKFGETTI